MQINSRNLWPWYFLAAAFESIFFIVILFSIPSETGLSLGRFALISVLLLILILSISFGLHARHDTVSLEALPRAPLIAASTLLAVTSGLALFLLRYLDPERFLPFYERVGPLLWFFLIFGIQSALFLLFLQNGFHPAEFLKRKVLYHTAGVVFVVLLILVGFVALTKLGITPDTAYWGEPGVAILGWHFGLSILIGFGILIGGAGLSSFRTSRFQSYILPFAIWLVAVGLWLSVPWDVLQSSFYAPITPPAEIPFPYSDAGYYDYIAQSLLVGTDYMHLVPPRPLYILFLAGLHTLFGQDYIAIIAAQTLVLALFPVVLYFLAKKLHSPAAGVTVAFLAIFREYLGLWISSNTRVANSKIFTTDFPTALGVAVLSLVVIWWLERRDLKSSLIAGGAFGLLLLLRTQSLVILPVLFVLAWFVFERRTKQWLLACLGFFLAVILTITPWLVHNYTVTGKFTFDDPNTQMAALFSQYSFTGNNDLSQFAVQNQSLGQRMLSFTLANPGYVAGFVTNHFLNTEIGGLLALPLIERFDGIFAAVNLYWMSWNGMLAWYNLILLILYLGIIGVGLAAAWRHLRWIGLVPLAFNLGYAFSNGIARFSSWRYNLPVDWVIYFYFAIGLVEILGGLTLLFGAKAENVFGQTQKVSPAPESMSNVQRRLLTMIGILAAFAFVGAMPWLAKGFVPQRYTSTNEQLITQLETSGQPSGEIQSFLAQPDAVLLEGRILYPRMYRKDQGISSAHPWPAYAVRDYARMAFILINQGRYDAIFMTRDPLDIPQGADAILLGCMRDDYIETRLIELGTATFQSAPLTDPCH